MTTQQVAREVRKRWGGKGWYRASGPSSSALEREEATQRRDALKARKEAIDAEVKARLEALDWYQALMAERREVLKGIDAARSVAVHYRYGVGRDLGWAHEVVGQGDSWSDALANADLRSS